MDAVLGAIASLFRIALVAILVNNFIFAKFLGICPFLGVSKKTDTAVGMGLAVIFVMTVASAATWAIQEFILIPLGAEYLQTIAFILVIAVLVQFVEMVLQKLSPALYSALGIYLPLITTNCAVLGVALINIQEEFGFLKSVAYGCFSGVGFTLAIVLFAGVRERLEDADIPEFMKGVPIALVTAGLMAIAFMGFQNIATL